MKRLFCALIFTLLMLASCAKQEPPALPSETVAKPTVTLKHVEWEIKTTPVPTPIPTPRLDKGESSCFTEIDIDSSDEYRDFAAEFRYGDTYGETVLYRLKEEGYVELGTIPGCYMTEKLGNRIPTIMADGSGMVYTIEQSRLASWADIAKVYVVENDELVLQPERESLFKLKESMPFFVKEKVTLGDVHEPEKYIQLEPGDWVTFDYSDEDSMLIGSYSSGDEYKTVVLFMDSLDFLYDGRFFGSCFYNENVEWVG